MAIKCIEQRGFWKDRDFRRPFFQNFMLCVDVVKAMPVFSRLEMEDRVTYINKILLIKTLIESTPKRNQLYVS
jgi:hypothetical protein